MKVSKNEEIFGSIDEQGSTCVIKKSFVYGGMIVYDYIQWDNIILTMRDEKFGRNLRQSTLFFDKIYVKIWVCV